MDQRGQSNNELAPYFKGEVPPFFLMGVFLQSEWYSKKRAPQGDTKSVTKDNKNDEHLS